MKRRAEQELVSELNRGRYSSFPILSPDTFRAMCDVVIEGNKITRRASMAGRTVIFFCPSEIQATGTSFEGMPELNLLESELSNTVVPPVVIISGRDFVPSRDLLRKIAYRCAKVFSVNLSEETHQIRAIPLGIENFSGNPKAGLKDYSQHYRAFPQIERKRDVFAAFEQKKDPSVPGQMGELLGNRRFGWNSRRLCPERYRSIVSESRFVLSPPGTGLDSHRTWEAIYLGAVPVVLEGTLPAAFISKLPIHAVSSYQEFLARSHDDMVELYGKERLKSVDIAYAPYWIAEIRKALKS